jgi:two-component system response regulator
MSISSHVLLVEDNEADIDLTREALESTRFDIKLSVAKDGVEAIEFLDGVGSWSEPGHPTLILLDLNLPRKNGRQVLAVIKGHEQFRRIPVVVLSSSDSEKDITSCYELGANCYIVKPVELHAYRAIIRTLEDF